MMPIYIGIDCGFDGAVAAMIDGRISFFDTPTVNVGSKGKVKRAYDVGAMAAHLRELRPDMAFVEKQQAMPSSLHGRTQGTVSSFSTGYGYGLWVGMLTALQIPHELIHPTTWKLAMMKDMGKEKGASIIKAKQLFPKAADYLKLKKHHGRADALLILECGRRAMTTPANPCESGASDRGEAGLFEEPDHATKM